MTGDFIKVKCKKCKNEQVVFQKAASKVVCLVCNEPLLALKGGKAELLADSLGKV
ncbi:MAG TPA: 30S ribosomal protein S27e [archaeon]|nr:30S ribosomal protein S27e [archaeon]